MNPSVASRFVASRWREALAMVLRIALATVGGYLLTSLMTVALALLWPLPKGQAVMAATMLSFLVYAALIMWVFHEPSLRRILAILTLACVLLAAALWLFSPLPLFPEVAP